MNQILLDAGIRITGNAIIYDYPASILNGRFVQLRWRHTPENLARLESFIAERSLAPSDFKYPPKHREIRGAYQATLEDATVTKSSDQSPLLTGSAAAQSALDEYRKYKQTDTYEKQLERDVEKAEAAELAAMSEAERYARNEPQIEHATWQFLELAFSDCPQQEISAVERRLQVARDGTLQQYSGADKAYRDRVKANAEQKKAELQGRLLQEAEAVDAQIKSIESAAWVDSTNPQEKEQT